MNFPHPQDFPLLPIWHKPPFEDLMACLRKLRAEPIVWSFKTRRGSICQEQLFSRQQSRDVVSYISNVIKSNLSWIEDDDQKEQVWEEASKRLAERCGRSAMGEIIRKWPFEKADGSRFDLAIREPALTGDDLGLKTWGSSYVLAQMLDGFASKSLAHLFGRPRIEEAVAVLELGSGTGLLGLAAACIWKTDVVLSDIPSIMPNLVANIEQNLATVEANGGSIRAGALTWGGAESETDQALFREKHQFKMILAADLLYDDHHPKVLAAAMHEQLSYHRDARILVMSPKRDCTTVGLMSELRRHLSQLHIGCIVDGCEVGEDDWGVKGDESRGVECWWGLFGRNGNTSLSE